MWLIVLFLLLTFADDPGAVLGLVLVTLVVMTLVHACMGGF